MRKKLITGAAVGAAAGIAGYMAGKKRPAPKTVQNFTLRPGVPKDDPESVLGCDKKFSIDKNKRVSVLITGAGSYIGESFRAYCEQNYPENISVTTMDMEDGSWKDGTFADDGGRPFDTVFHVAGIAHADAGRVTAEEREKYYRINTDLAVETAEKSREVGVKQFIFMSSMIIYGGAEYINRDTKPSPVNFYGDSKWQADKGVRRLESGDFQVAVLRPPMIYGAGSKGNYPTLSRIARRVPVFPDYKNKRSMLYIGNLCELLCQVMIGGKGGVYFPQNSEYVTTSRMVREIGNVVGKSVHMTKLLNPLVVVAIHVPGIVGRIASKAFGNSWYDQNMSVYEDLEYQKMDLIASIERTELWRE